MMVHDSITYRFPRYAVAPVRRRPCRIAKKIAKRLGMATFAGAHSRRLLDKADKIIGEMFDDGSMLAPTRTDILLRKIMDVSKFDEGQRLSDEEQHEFEREFNSE